MRTILISLALASAAALPVAATAQQAEAPAAAHYSVETTLIGTLLDDPAAAAILEKLIPTIYANEMFRTMGRQIPLKAVQQYESTILNDEMLAKIQAEFDKLPPK